MDVGMMQYPPGDSRMIEKIVHQLKSQGIFDQFRKECIADVDTKPAYQNLHQRVEGSVSGFLASQVWRPDLNKNQLRDSLRKHIHESGFLDIGVERIVDQVVNPKILTVFMPQVEDVVYKFLGIEKPKKGKGNQNVYVPPFTFENTARKEERKLPTLTDLLPKELEPISPESDTLKDDEYNSDEAEEVELRGVKEEEDSSPPFEPIEEVHSHIGESSVDSHLSGISELTSHDSQHSHVSFVISNHAHENNATTKLPAVDVSNSDSQLSKVSSGSRLSIVSLCEHDSKLSHDVEISDHSKQSDSSLHISGQETQMSVSMEFTNDENEVKSGDSHASKDMFCEGISICTNKWQTYMRDSSHNVSDGMTNQENPTRRESVTEEKGLDEKSEKEFDDLFERMCNNTPGTRFVEEYKNRNVVFGYKCNENEGKILADKCENKTHVSNDEKTNEILEETVEKNTDDKSERSIDKRAELWNELKLGETYMKKESEKCEKMSDDELERKVGKKYENRSDENLEKKLDEKYGGQVDEKSERKLEEKPESNPGERSEVKLNDKFDRKLDEKSARRVDEKYEKKPEDKFEGKLLEKPEKYGETSEWKRDDKKERKSDEKSERKLDERPERKSDETSENEKLERKLTEKYERRSDEKLERKLVEKDRKMDEKSEKKYDEKYERKLVEKYVGKLDEKTERKSERKYDENSEWKLDEMTERKSVERSEKKSLEKLEKKVLEKPERKLEEMSEKKSDEKLERKLVEKPERKSEEKSEKKVEEKLEKKLVEKPERKSEEKSEKKSEEKLERKWTEKPERKSEEKSEKTSDEKLERKLVEKPERKSEEKCERRSEEKLDRKFVEKPERKSEEKSEKKSEEKLERKLVEKPERKSEDKSEKKSEEKLERKLIEKPERKSEEKSEKKSEEKLERKLIEKPERKSEEKSEKKSDEKLERKLIEKPERRSEEKSEKKSEEKLERKLVEKPERKSEEKSEKKSDEKLERKLIEKTERKSEETFEKKSDEKLERKLVEKSERKSFEKSGKRSDEKLDSRSVEKSERKSDEKSEKKLDEKLMKKSDERSGKKIDEKSEKRLADKSEKKIDIKLVRKTDEKSDKKPDARLEKKVDDKHDRKEVKYREDRDKARIKPEEKKQSNSENKDIKKNDHSGHSSEGDRKRSDKDKNKKDRGDSRSRAERSNKDGKEKIEKGGVKEKIEHEEKSEKGVMKEEFKSEVKEKKVGKDSSKDKSKKEDGAVTRHEKGTKKSKSDAKRGRELKVKPKLGEKGQMKHDDKHKDRSKSEKSDKDKSAQFDDRNSKDGSRSSSKESRDRVKQEIKGKGKDMTNKSDEKKGKDKSTHGDKTSKGTEKGIVKKADREKKERDSTKSSHTGHKSKDRGKKGKENKGKIVSDDHRIHRDKHSDDRRSTDRDSNGTPQDRSHGSTTSRTNVNDSQRTQSRHNKSGGSTNSSKSDTGGNSDSSGASTQTVGSSKNDEENIPSSSKSTSPPSSLPFKKRPVSVQSEDECESTHGRNGKLSCNKIKKPKIAANIFEVKKIMMLRKSLAKKERKQQKELQKNKNIKEGVKEMKRGKKVTKPVVAKRRKLGNVEKSLRNEIDISLSNKQMPEVQNKKGDFPELKYFDSELVPTALSGADSDFLAYVKRLVECDNLSEISTSSESGSEVGDVDDIIHLPSFYLDDIVAAELGAKIVQTDKGTEVVLDLPEDEDLRKEALPSMNSTILGSLCMTNKNSTVLDPFLLTPSPKGAIIFDSCDDTVRNSTEERTDLRSASAHSSSADTSPEHMLNDKRVKRVTRQLSSSVASTNGNKSTCERIEVSSNGLDTGKALDYGSKLHRKRVYSKKRVKKDTASVSEMKPPEVAGEKWDLRRARKPNTRYSDKIFASCLEDEDLSHDAFSEERDNIILDEFPTDGISDVSKGVPDKANSVSPISSGRNKICFRRMKVPATITQAGDGNSDREIVPEPLAGDTYYIVKDNNNIDKGSSEDERGCGEGSMLNQDLILPTLRNLMVECGFRREDDKSDILPSPGKVENSVGDSLLVTGSNVSIIRAAHEAREGPEKRQQKLGRSRRVGLGRPPVKRSSEQVCDDDTGNRTPPPSNVSDFVMPLSPESDVSASSGEAKRPILHSRVGESLTDPSPSNSDKNDEQMSNSRISDTEIKRNLRSGGVGTPGGRAQRYSSDDLYKPRPLFSQCSRRVRGLVSSSLSQEAVTNCTSKRHGSDIAEALMPSSKRRR